MTPEPMPVREPLRSAEIQKPSPALALRLYHGVLDSAQPITKDSEKDGFKSATAALDNRNRAARKADEAKFAAKWPKLSREELRDSQMQIWSQGARAELMHDLGVEGRGSRTKSILTNKLGIPLTGEGETDAPILLKQLYDADAKTAGDFYKNFCGPDMNKKLTILSVDEMMHMKSFLTKWMLGSEDAFNALVTLRQSMDFVDTAEKTSSLDSHYDASLLDADKPMLDYFYKGLSLKDEDEEEKSTVNQQVTTAEPDEKQENSPLHIQTGSKTEAHPEHPDRNDDSFFLSEDGKTGGIFDGAGGHYKPEVASQTARDIVKETLATLSPEATLEETQIKLVEAMKKAQEGVRLIPLPEGEKYPMTTGTIYHVWQGSNGEQKLLIASIGDSRLWMKQANGEVTYLTLDDNALKAQMRKGGLPPDQYKEIQDKIDNAQTQEDIAALGPYWDQSGVTAMLGITDAIPDYAIVDIKPGDMIFLTTDGIHDNLSLPEITDIAHSTMDPQELSDRLVARAKEISESNSPRSKPDDITALAATIQKQAA